MVLSFLSNLMTNQMAYKHFTGWVVKNNLKFGLHSVQLKFETIELNRTKLNYKQGESTQKLGHFFGSPAPMEYSLRIQILVVINYFQQLWLFVLFKKLCK
jgi:hypothetical protein